MTKLTAAARHRIPKKDFAGPDKSYPIEDESHARNALARVSQHGSSTVKKRVRSAVKRKYPGIKQSKKRGGHAMGGRSRRRADKRGRC